METTNNQQTETTTAQSVGDIMQNGKTEAIKRLIIFIGALVYIAGIVYAESHALNILQDGVAPDFLLWAYAGMIAAGISALVLPLALHYWTFEALHRIAAFAFYGVDIALLMFNSFTDFGVNAGQTLPQWAQFYVSYILPASPVIVAMGWSILFLMDPSVKSHILKQTLQASIREALGQQMIEAAKGANVSESVKTAAQAEVNNTLKDLFGREVVVKEQTVAAPNLKPEEQPSQGAKFQG